jgi:small subunit ribosomal protein S3
MGQKTPARLNRLNFSSQKSTACWYKSKSKFADSLNEDLVIRKYFDKKYFLAAINDVVIERHQTITITVHCAKPGLIIGKKGADIDAIKIDLHRLINAKVHVNVKEVKKVDLQAKLVAENIAQQLERRVMFRKAMKRALQNSMRSGALGVRIEISGRLGGVEIARSEKYHTGRVPLHTFKADIDYYIATALTTYGIIGIKVWIYRPDASHFSGRKKIVKKES